MQRIAVKIYNEMPNVLRNASLKSYLQEPRSFVTAVFHSFNIHSCTCLCTWLSFAMAIEKKMK